MNIIIDNNLLYLLLSIGCVSILTWGTWITKKVFSHDSCMARVEQKLDDLKENGTNTSNRIEKKLDELMKKN